MTQMNRSPCLPITSALTLASAAQYSFVQESISKPDEQGKVREQATINTPALVLKETAAGKPVRVLDEDSRPLGYYSIRDWQVLKVR